ncbi:predicted protein [Plenodomus lingam JN3]|uniref:Predicted protein n=1 Tax=Leptosphaeria maculans (strain JN3 / isolate v23.1.3 / race Av1-4-5-6-7-8) TaxID=985895 RepID=E4ZTL9_LEPMJ|nr:predicted protein [Plenodomus lingam JN3]CBX94875.1 predicted protein [Plenodomus lingam JN3]
MSLVYLVLGQAWGVSLWFGDSSRLAMGRVLTVRGDG